MAVTVGYGINFNNENSDEGICCLLHISLRFHLASIQPHTIPCTGMFEQNITSTVILETTLSLYRLPKAYPYSEQIKDRKQEK